MTNSNTLSEWETRVEAGFFKMTVEFLQHPELRNTIVMGCRPANPDHYPEATRPIYLDLEHRAPSDDTWMVVACRCCGLDMLMGPHQRTNYELDPTAFTLLCFLCARKALGPNMTLESSGGK